MNCKKTFLFLFGCLITLWATAADSFSIANTLQPNMVVQQGKPLVIWGKAPAGAKLQIRCSWQQKEKETFADASGNWRTEVQVPMAVPHSFTPNSIAVKSGSETKTLSNILIGDVWLCGGQSNMDMELKPFLPWLLGTDHYRMEIENAAYPQIRFFNVRTDFKANQQEDCGGTWMVCSPQTAPMLSAVAYFFARQVFLKKGIPIGLVVSSVGGSSAQAWVSRDTLTADKVLQQKYLYAYDTSARAKEVLDSSVTFEKVVRPTLFYNAMIYPLRHLRFTGALWYQGESNRHDSAMYTRLNAALIRNWRNLFNHAQMPFYYVQVAPFNWGIKDTTLYDYAVFREAQAKVKEVVPYTGMVVTMDIADPTDIHPRNKQDVGYRLAKMALANVYGETNTVYTGPEYASHRVEGETLKILFKNTGSGLVTNDGQPPRHFYIAGADGVFHYAQATIEKNEVWLRSEKVKTPLAVRYAFTNYPVTNLENAEGFPAVPFRSHQ